MNSIWQTNQSTNQPKNRHAWRYKLPCKSEKKNQQHIQHSIRRWFPHCVTVCTYPCISLRRQRVSHPGAEPGSGRLDGDGVADARQFAACWKERSEIGENLEQRPAGCSGSTQNPLLLFYFQSKRLKDDAVDGQLFAATPLPFPYRRMFCAGGAYYSVHTC